MDEAERLEIEIDERALSKDLGIPVVATSARYKKGIPELIETIRDVAVGKIKCKPHRIKNVPKHIQKAVNKLSAEIKKLYPDIPNSRWIAFRLLDGDRRIMNAIETGEFINTEKDLESA
jgi:ferrous iron transport protein B